MKKVAIVVVGLLMTSFVSQAQLKFGVKAGANVSKLSASVDEMASQIKGATDYQFGVLMQAKAFGIVIQPEVLYSVKSDFISDPSITELFDGQEVAYSSQNIEIPLNFQVGFGFLVGRAYLQAGPYVSFVASTLMNGTSNYAENVKNSMSTFDYGVGAGAGLEFFHFQLSAKYDWGMGKLGDATYLNGGTPTSNPFNNLSNRTLSVSLAYLF
jgi:hypothetical protein